MEGQVSPFIRGLLTTNESGEVEAPDNIISTLPAAYQQYIALRNAHLERIALYAAVEGMIGGNPPYDQTELEANGLGHIANFNTFKGRSTYEKSAQGLWNLVNATEVLVNINIAGNFPRKKEYAEIMARHFSDIIKEWPDFEPNFNLLGAQLTKFGISPVFFPHEESPLWEVVDLSKFYIPPQTLSYTSKLTNVCIDTVYTVQDIYQFYKTAEKSDHWNKDALEQFLITRANALTWNSATPIVTMMDLQRIINNNDANVMRFFSDTVRLVNMFQVEYDDGKVSRYIFSADMFETVSSKIGGNTTADFMFFADRIYKSIEDAIIIFTSTPGEWTVHGNLGVGTKIFPMIQAINMLDCNIFDMTRLAGTPIIRTLAAGGRDGSAIRVYPGTFTDVGTAEFVQNNLGSNINQMVGASSYLNNAIDMNMINSGEDPGQADRAQGSIAPYAQRQQDFKEFGVLRNVVAHFYNTFDKVMRTVFIRFLTMKESAPGYEYAKEWRERCLEDGVPEFLFDTAKRGLHGLPKQFRSIKATRVAGDGSTLARIMGLEALDKIATTFNQEEMAAYKREWVTATMGVDYVEMFASSDSQGDEVNGGFSLAVVENGLMKVGQPAAFSPDNEQDQHAMAHMQLLIETVKAIEAQQLSPVDADKIFDLAIPHEQQHIQFMLQSPLFYGQVLRQLDKPFKQVVQFAQLNKKNAQAMMEAAIKKQQEDAQKTSQVMQDAQRKDFVAAKDVERKDVESEAKMERADEAGKAKASAAEEKIRRDAENKRLKITLDAQAKAGDLEEDLQESRGETPSPVDFEALPGQPQFAINPSKASDFNLAGVSRPTAFTTFKSENK